MTDGFQTDDGSNEGGNEKQSPKCCRFFENQNPDNYAANCANARPDCISCADRQSVWTGNRLEH